MSTPVALTTTPYTLEQLEVLAAYKQHMTQGRETNVTPFWEDDVIRYHTPVADYDVPEIHGEVREAVRQGLQTVRQRGQSRVVILVGDPGMGKSHLINYFRLPATVEELDYVLVCNANSWKVNEFEECLLDWLIGALTRPAGGGPDLLRERIRDIAFQALEDVLATPGRVREFLGKSHQGFLLRIQAVFGRSLHEQLQEAVRKRDASVFRRLNFRELARYVCNRYLYDEAGNPFQSYLMKVLLCYLFREERDIVLHWLRGKDVGDHFLHRLGAKDVRDRHYKVFDALKVLISLFTPEVTRGLKGSGEAAPLRDKLFFFAFDQIEGRQELFEGEPDWFRFFAQLAELYNALPNVFILFTMTLKLRDILHPKLERQFKERIRNDHRFILRYLEAPEVLSLYRQRVRRWLRSKPELKNRLEELENPFLPFDQAKVVDMAGRGATVRQTLRNWDEAFRQTLDKIPIRVPLDYEVKIKEIRLQKEEFKNEYEATEGHLATVYRLLELLGERLAAEYGIKLTAFKAIEFADKHEALQLQFGDQVEGGGRVRFNLVRLSTQYNARISLAMDLIKQKAKDKNHLWFTRPKDFNFDPLTIKNYEDQVHKGLSPPEPESSLQAIISIWEQKEQYPPKEWMEGEQFLLKKICSTYLGDLFGEASKILNGGLLLPEEPFPVDSAVSVAEEVQ